MFAFGSMLVLWRKEAHNALSSSREDYPYTAFRAHQSQVCAALLPANGIVQVELAVSLVTIGDCHRAMCS